MRIALDKGSRTKDPIRTQSQDGVRIHYLHLNQRLFCVSKFMRELSQSMETQHHKKICVKKNVRRLKRP